jgi:hypothetical protein
MYVCARSLLNKRIHACGTFQKYQMLRLQRTFKTFGKRACMNAFVDVNSTPTKLLDSQINTIPTMIRLLEAGIKVLE